MRIRIEKRGVTRFFIGICIGMVLFSSTCLWNENSLRTYIYVNAAILGLTAIIWVFNIVSINRIINNRYILWVIGFYTLMELYGLLFLRTGGFNWDLILVGGLIQIALTILIMILENMNDVIEVFCKSCKWSLVFICIYMYLQGSLKISNIVFGSRIGDELSGNVNTVATCLGTILIPTFYWYLVGEKKLTTAAICIVSSGCMLLTGSKKGVIALAIMLSMYFWVRKTPLKYVIVFGSAIVGIYAVFNVPVLYNTIGFRIKDAFATLGFGTSVTNATSTRIRNDYIHMGLKSFLNVPLFGGGMNYFQYINRARFYSHNNYVELLNTFGLFGTVVFYFPFLRHLVFFVKSLRKTKRAKTSIENDNMNYIYIFIIMFLFAKLFFDYAMVSFTALCIFYIPFLLSSELYRRIRNEKL